MYLSTYKYLMLHPGAVQAGNFVNPGLMGVPSG